MFWNVGKNHWIKDSEKFGIRSSVETFRLLATRGLREIELRLQLAQSVPAVAVPLKIDLHLEETIRLKRIFSFLHFRENCLRN